MNMDRRSFLKTVAAGGSLLVVTAATAPKLLQASTPKNAMLIVVPNCIGCDHCVFADEQYHSGLSAPNLSLHTGTTWPTANAYTKVVTQPPYGTMPIAQNCLHCINAPCATVCQTHALTQQATGTVTYDADMCIGCYLCTTVCPFGSITTDNANRKILKCDHCAKFTETSDTAPFCVQVCPGQMSPALATAFPKMVSKNWGSYSDMVTLGQKVVQTLNQTTGTDATLLYQNDTSTFYVVTAAEFKAFSTSPEVTVIKSAYPNQNKLYSTAEHWIRLAWIPLLAGVAFFALRWRDNKGEEKPLVAKKEEN
jgi:Fe-S-cluster-containing dehydrogenase component